MEEDLSRVVALMFHALYDKEEELRLFPPEERAYAISVAMFKQHLYLINECGVDVINPVTFFNNEELLQTSVLLTFDDGDVSFFNLINQVLNDFFLKGLFFITAGFIGGKPRWCSPEHVSKLYENGHTVGSHGMTHRFLTDLSDDECLYELTESKRLLEEWCGGKVKALSFPGGRFGSREMNFAGDCGYEFVFSSRFGVIDMNRFNNRSDLARVAVFNSTTVREMRSIVKLDPFYWQRRKAFEGFKGKVKLLLGNSLYHSIYRVVKSFSR